MNTFFPVVSVVDIVVCFIIIRIQDTREYRKKSFL